MGAESSDDSMPFIITGSTGISVKEQRKLIRSHVMRGKNRKALPSKPPSWINYLGVEDGPITENNPFPIPNRVGGDLSLANLSAEISPAVFRGIMRLKEAMTPPWVSLSPIQTDGSWLGPIRDDPVCFHFTIFVAQAYHDFRQGQKENSKFAMIHFVKALEILQQRLCSSQSETPTSNSTILTVIGLTMVSIALGDFATAMIHFEGLRKMVTLRGGILAFSQNRLLQIKILRVDLGISLSTGHQPLFFTHHISWDPYITSHERKLVPFDTKRLHVLGAGFDLEHFIEGLDTRLRSIWNDLAEFARSVDIAAKCKLGIDSELYQEVMISVHYRLLNLHFEINSMNEIIRLALLSFASIVFLQWDGVKFRYEYLNQRFKATLGYVIHGAEPIPQQLTLWLYTIGAISTFDRDEQTWFKPVLIRILGDLGCKTWDEVEPLLKSIIWVDVLLGSLMERMMKDNLGDFPQICQS
ncbi:hypothetical protein F4806DRAFT_237055 [Annulohypoxylon nitens]|nr:hypothetical protein F4806DRAFT_237055 [Annulohypoxylon nitens]